MKNFDNNVLVAKSSKAATRSYNDIQFELKQDDEVGLMVGKILEVVREMPASYAKKERALIIANEILFLNLTTRRQGQH